MEPITSNEFLNSVLEAKAWENISIREHLSMEMLEKYANKLSWEEISRNSDVVWTLEGITKFANKINWVEFSKSCPDNIISETALQKFIDRWDWKELSNREALYNNWDLLEIFADRVNWGEIINIWRIERPLEFFKRFEKYIPMIQLPNSSLWDAMVEVRANQLTQQFLTSH